MVLRRLLREELTRGIGVNVVFIGAQAAITLVASVIAARYLGPQGVGIVAIGLLIAEFVSVIDNLPSQGFVRDMASAPSPAKVATVLGTKGALGLAMTVVLLLASPFLAEFFHVPVAIPAIFALIPTASIVSSVALMSWEARRDMVRRNATQLAEAVARLVLYLVVAFAVVFPFSPEATISLATLAASVVASLVGIAIIPSLSLKGFEKERALDYLRFGLRAQSTGALQKVLFWFDIALIQLYLGAETQGLYKTAYTLMSNLTVATGTVAIMMYPTIATALGRGDHESARRTFSVGAFISMAIAAPFAFVFIVFPELILGLLMGPEFLPAAWMLRALGFLGILAVLLVPFEVYFPAIGRPDLGLRLAAVEVTTNVALNLALVPRIGVMGAVIATGAAFLIGLGIAVYTLRSLGHELPRWDDVTEMLRPSIAHPPDEPPLV